MAGPLHQKIFAVVPGYTQSRLHKGENLKGYITVACFPLSLPPSPFIPKGNRNQNYN